MIACLDQLRDWSDANPSHLPIVINLELKEGALPAPFDLTPITPFDSTELDGVDAEIRSVLGDRLITPDDVRGDAADLRSAIESDGWPTVAETRGRFLFFLDNAGATEARYLDGHPSLAGRVLFTSAGEGRADGAVLKVNDPGDGTRIRSLVEDGYLVRTRADADVGVAVGRAAGHGARLRGADRAQRLPRRSGPAPRRLRGELRDPGGGALQPRADDPGDLLAGSGGRTALTRCSPSGHRTLLKKLWTSTAATCTVTRVTGRLGP